MKNFITVVINLDRQKDRYEWFRQQNPFLGVERVSAVDAQHPVNKEIISKFKGPNSKLTDGEIACILSHRKAWQVFLDTDTDYLVVFEDDVYIGNDINFFLDELMLEQTYDLLKIETTFKKVSLSYKNKTSITKRKVMRLLTRHYGSAGYVISRNCAEYLLSLTQSCYEPVDFMLFDPRSPLWSYVEVFQACPALCVQQIFYGGYLDKNKIDTTSSLEKERQRRNISDVSHLGWKEIFFKKLRLKKTRKYITCVWNGARTFNYMEAVDYAERVF